MKIKIINTNTKNLQQLIFYFTYFCIIIFNKSLLLYLKIANDVIYKKNIFIIPVFILFNLKLIDDYKIKNTCKNYIYNIRIEILFDDKSLFFVM